MLLLTVWHLFLLSQTEAHKYIRAVKSTSEGTHVKSVARLG